MTTSAPDKAGRYAVAYFIGGVVSVVTFLYLTIRTTPPQSPKLDRPGKILLVQGGGDWRPIADVKLPSIVSMRFSPDGLTGVAASADGELVQSTDGGLTWQQISRPPIDGQAENITALALSRGQITLSSAIEESDFTALYLYAGRWVTHTGATGGILASSPDSGLLAGGFGLLGMDSPKGWRFIKVPGLENSTIYCVASHGNMMLAGSSDGILARSIDGGDSWTLSKFSAPAGARSPETIYSVATDGSVSVAGGLNGQVWRSDTGGATWSPVRGLTGEMMVSAILMVPRTNDLALGGGDPSGANPFLCYSVDGGVTWTLDAVHTAFGRITSLASTKVAMLASTSDGYILRRYTH